MIEVLTEILKGITSLFIYFWWLFALIFAFFAWQNHRKADWVSEQEEVVLEIKIPKTNDKTPTAAEMMFATLHGILKPKADLVKEGAIQEHLSFEIVADMNSIRFYVWTPKHLKDFVEGQIYAQYPSAEITITEDYAKDVVIGDGRNLHVKGAELVLTREDFLPIKTFNNFQVDPLAGITGVLSKLEEKNEQIWIQMLARPVSDEWRKTGMNWISSKKGGTLDLDMNKIGKALIKLPLTIIVELAKALVSSPSEVSAAGKKELSSEDASRASAIEEKAEKLAFKVRIRTAYISEHPERGEEKISAIFGAFKQYNTTILNGFKGKNVHNSKGFLEDYRNRLFMDGGYHLNIEEIASIYHMPHTSVETPNINWTNSKAGEPPTTLPTPDNTTEEDLTPFAETNFRSHRQIFGIKRDDRRRHMYVIGKSGMGKTKLLENLINYDIQKGEGVAVVDPHGDLIASTLAKLPPERIKDVILFDPSDTNHPIGFNPMEVIDESLKIQIAAGVLGTFKKIFGHSWGPRLEYVFNYTLLALLDTPGSTILGVVNMLTDKNFRKDIIANIQDPVVKKFWTTEWASYSEKFASEAVAPILNKVGQFTANSLIRNILGQPKSTFNIRQAMDEGKILLINLSSGRVGETNASLMGAMMITAIQLAAMSRADIDEADRRDFYLYVDEFQNFATESFAVILSEARKYHLCLTMANQYVAQMEDTGVKDAIFGNVGTIISFRVGAQDANELAREFTTPFEPQDFINLARQHIYIRMTIEGQSEQAFSAKTLTVSSDTTDVIKDVINNSRNVYTRPRLEVEKEIADYTGIEIMAVKSGTETEVKIKTADETITVSDNEIFEAPLVKRVSRKNKSSDKDKLKEIIRQNVTANSESNKDTARAEKTEPKERAAEPKATIKEPTHEKGKIEPEEAPLKIKDKIDKETLSAILKNVVSPKENTDTSKGKEPEHKIQKHNREVAPVDNTKTEKKGDLAEEKPKGREELKIQPIDNSTFGQEIIKNIKDDSTPRSTEKEIVETKKQNPVPSEQNAERVVSPSSQRREKVVTPDSFKRLKEIHPHEVVKIVSETPKDLEEGKEIKF